VNIFTESKSGLAKKLLAQKGWTRRDLALRTGIPVAVISNVLCGNNRCRRPRQAIQEALATTLWPEIASASVNTTKERMTR
jgi:transcriptional regulator with XRE-family HTH domain